MNRAEVRIGTSGWHYKHWLGNFYPERLPSSKMLEFYYQRFDTVEINNSFYKLLLQAPQPQHLRVLAREHSAQFSLRREGKPLHHPQ